MDAGVGGGVTERARLSHHALLVKTYVLFFTTIIAKLAILRNGFTTITAIYGVVRG